MLEYLQPVWVITRREVRDQLRDWRIIAPLVILTLFFPALMDFTAQRMVAFVRSQGGGDIIFARLVPFLLMIVGFFPITVSLVIALESFAGETERRSIEPLLDSPLTDFQLFLGKLLAAVFASVSASYLGTIVYLLGVYFTIQWKPPLELLIQVLILSFVQTLVMVSGAIVVSTQTTSVRAANLLSSFIIVPMALLLQVESVIMFWADYSVLWWMILGQVVIAGLLVRTGLAHFNREELLGRELDTIDLKAGWRLFKQSFVGAAHSFGAWYRHEVATTLRNLALPFGLMAPMTLAGFWVGAQLSAQIPLDEGLHQWVEIARQGGVLQDFTRAGWDVSVATALLIWLNNLKSVVLVSLFGIFSFGVGGILGLMVTIATLGILGGLIAQAGYSPWLIVTAYFLPHGLLEIPAIMLAGAAILRLGTVMVTPAQGQTIGQAWVRALADWVKVVLAILLPLFLLAALVEVFVTPRFALLLLQN